MRAKNSKRGEGAKKAQTAIQHRLRLKNAQNGSANAVIHKPQNKDHAGEGNVESAGQLAEPAGQGLCAALVQLFLNAAPTQHKVDGEGPQHRAKGADDDGDEVHPVAGEGVGLQKDADTGTDGGAAASFQ